MEQEQLLSKLNKVFNSPDGLDVLMWMLDICKVDETIFQKGSDIYGDAKLQEFGIILKALCIKANNKIGHSLLDRQIDHWQNMEAK